MKVPVSWLREYVDTDATTAEIAGRLAIATGEVERISFRGVADVDGNLGLYRVGRVLEAGKHPDADRLQLCRVDVGEEEPRQIVCGAWNFGPGATVAVALPGAVLPDGRTLERAKLRGTVSDGMILSETELELGADHAGILVLSEPWEPGTPLGDVLPLGEEILEIEVTRNRPDCLSVYGIAREVAALFAAQLRRAPGRRARADRRGDAGHRDRGLRGLPALHRPALPRRPHRPVAAVAQGADHGGRDAPDLERRRRDELRDARRREPAARVRLRHARGRPHRRPPGAAGRGVHEPRREPAEARSRGPRHRRRRARDRLRGDHGRPRHGGARGDDLRPPRGGELRAGHDPLELGAPRAPHGGVEPLGERRRPPPRARRGGAGHAADGRADGRPLDRRGRRQGRPARARHRLLPHGEGESRHRPRDPRAGAEGRARASRLRRSRRVAGDGADVAGAGRHVARSTSSRRSLASTAWRRSPSPCPSGASCRAA